jgi:predicted nucleic acid-binding protein
MPNNPYNIFVDTNVLIGAYLGNKEDARCLKRLSDVDGKRLFISILSVAQLVSVFQKRKSNTEIVDIVHLLQAKFNILTFTEDDLNKALTLSGTDIEDNIQYVISRKMNCFYFVTNNRKDYVSFFNVDVLLPSNINKAIGE